MEWTFVFDSRCEDRGELEAVRRRLYRVNGMNRIRLGLRVLLALLTLSLALSSTAEAQLTREQGDRLERKIEEIAKNASSDPVRPKRTTMSELEINSYLAFNGKDKIPRGLANPQIVIGADGLLSGRRGPARRVRRHRRIQALSKLWRSFRSVELYLRPSAGDGARCISRSGWQRPVSTHFRRNSRRSLARADRPGACRFFLAHAGISQRLRHGCTV